jgi:hypothetical protein
MRKSTFKTLKSPFYTISLEKAMTRDKHLAIPLYYMATPLPISYSFSLSFPATSLSLPVLTSYTNPYTCISFGRNDVDFILSI